MLLRIFKTIATSGFVTALERSKFVFGWGSASDPAGGAYRAPPHSLAGLMGPTSKGEGRGEEGKKGKGRGQPPSQIPGSAPGVRIDWI